ncbi:MAG: M48 family metalloprotease [Planctomycetes bacterium]|nr:M48 family metalloprotease [Planctomycetota bacterium]
MFNIVGILLALIISETAQSAGSPAGLHSPIAAAASVLLVGFVSWWIAHGATGRLRYFRQLEQALAGGALDSPLIDRQQVTHQLACDRERFMRQVGWLRLATSALEIGAFAALCWLGGWTTFVTDVWHVPHGLDVIPFLLPYLGMMVAGWVGSYRLEVELRGRAWGFWSYLGHNLRMNLMTLAPIAVIQGGWWAIKAASPAVADAMSSFIYLEFAAYMAVAVVASIFLPVLVRWLLPTARMADGPLRTRLVNFAKARGVRVGNIFVWRTGSHHFTTAFLIGLIAPFRYVFITDALLRQLNEDEVEAVFAHELGHARHRHLWGLLAFLVAFSIVWMGIDAAISMAGGAGWFTTLGEGAAWKLQMLSLGVALMYGYISFGYISRRMERQADFYAAKHTSPQLIASALLRVGQIGGHSLRRHGWRHFSIEQRVKELVLLAQRPEVEPVLNMEFRRAVLGVLLATVLSVAALAPSVQKDVVTGLASYSFTQFDRERIAPQRDPARLEALRVRTIDRMHAMADYDHETKFFAQWYGGVMDTLAGRPTDAFDKLAREAEADMASAQSDTERKYARRMLTFVERGERAAQLARENGTRFTDEFDKFAKDER